MIKGIIFLIVLAFILRVLFVFQNAISFHYDMARDAYIAREIWRDHDLKILGPPTSTPNLYHGVLYYYLIAPFYGLGQGDPRFPAIVLSLLNSLTVIPILILAKNLFKSNGWAYFAGFLFAVGFEATQYGPWLSNPQPVVLTSSVFFLGLYLWQSKHPFGLYLAIISAALSSQFQLFMIYLFILIPIFGFIFKTKTTLKQTFFSIILAILVLSSFIISTIKFGTLTTILDGLFSISTSQFTFRTQFSDLFLNYLNRFVDIFINNFLPTNVFFGGIVSFIVLFFAKDNPFILFGLLSNILIFIFGGHNSTFANVGMISPAILGMIIVLQRLWQWRKIASILIMILVLLSNLYTIFKVSPKGQAVLVIPKDMILQKQLQLIDETYKIAGGEQFSINTLTLPLWTNTTWAYLYWWYGLKKYGYVPKFYGRDPVGQLGASDLQKIDQPFKTSFFIIEPHVGIPINIYDNEIADENPRTKLMKQINYGELKLQIRTSDLETNEK